MDQFHCPDRPAILGQLLKLLPRGRAWQTHEGLPQEGSTLRRTFAAVAEILGYATGRFCDLRREFFCDTAVETRDIWLAEYGLPDACDPSGGDLCIKVALQGGTRAEFLEEVAARYGFDIEALDPARAAVFPPDSYGALGDALSIPLVIEEPATQGLLPGIAFDRPVDLPWRPVDGSALAGQAIAGCTPVGCEEGCGADRELRGALSMPAIPWAYTIRVRIMRATSIALGLRPEASAGCAMAGCSHVEYRPDLSKIQCVIDRIAHAHIRVSYEIL